MKKRDYINENNLIKLKMDLSSERYTHSLNVMDAAIKLAIHYHCDEDKAAIAGLYHDCAKYNSSDKIREMSKKYGLDKDEELKKSVQLIHSYLGPFIAKDEYGIDDNDVLMAIRSHTTLRENPSLLEKIVYLADLIEVGREFSDVDELRELAFIDMDGAILKSLENTIKQLIDKKRYIGTDTLKARNYFLLKNLDKNRYF